MTRGGGSRPGLQLPLGVGLHAGRRLDNFVAGAGAGAAVLPALEALLDGGADPGHVFLHGPTATGKTHLLEACCARVADQGRRAAYLPLAERADWSEAILLGLAGANLICIDDVDRLVGDAAWQRAVFRLFNDADAAGSRMLFAARRPPACLELADLRSRLEAALRLRLDAPDDAVRARVLRARAAALGFELGDEVVDYVLARQPRDLHRLVALLAALDRFALAEKRRVTLPLVREFLRREAAAADEATGE